MGGEKKEVRGGKCMTPSSGRNTAFINESDDLSRSMCFFHSPHSNKNMES